MKHLGTHAISAALAVTLSWPMHAAAGPASGPEGPEPPPAADVEAPGAADPVDAARRDGDLSQAATLATEAREADPSAANWHREAQLREEMGDLDGAAAAYEGELAAMPKDDPGRSDVRGDLQRVRDQARGRVESEPASTHRAELDKAWAPPGKKKATKKKRAAEPVDAKGEDRIVRKWYFWVTVAAIVASAAAVTGIAIKASRDERRDALDRTRRNNLTVPPLFRF